MSEFKLWKDKIHGMQAKARSRIIAWGLIRAQCHTEQKEVPSLDQIVQVEKE